MTLPVAHDYLDCSNWPVSRVSVLVPKIKAEARTFFVASPSPTNFLAEHRLIIALLGFQRHYVGQRFKSSPFFQRTNLRRPGLHHWKRYGQRLVSCISHRDESVPHLHCVIVPLDVNGKLSFNAVFGGPKQLSELQTDYANALKPHGLRRGLPKCDTKAEHQTVKRCYQRLNAINEEHLFEEIAEMVEEIRAARHVTLSPPTAQREKGLGVR